MPPGIGFETASEAESGSEDGRSDEDSRGVDVRYIDTVMDKYAAGDGKCVSHNTVSSYSQSLYYLAL